MMRRCLLFLITLVLGSAIVACKPAFAVRHSLLNETPIGTTFERVLKYCSTVSLNCAVSKTAGFLNQDTGKVVGVQSIWATLSQNATIPLVKSTVTAYWGFGSDGRLIDIWVWRTNDAP
jgi:hypothetical protein